MKRVLLKLSGEALAGEQKRGFDEATVTEVAKQIRTIVDEGLQVGIVIGGGNFWRGRTSGAMDRSKADQIGMLATIMNCIYVSDICRYVGLKTEVFTPFVCGAFTTLYSKDAVEESFAAGKVVFLQAVQDILISPQIQLLYFVQLRSVQMLSFLRRRLTESMTAIRRLIRMPRSMTRFPLMR